MVGKLFQVAGKSPLGNRKRGGKLAGIATFVCFYVAEHFIYSATYTAIYSANRLTLVDFQRIEQFAEHKINKCARIVVCRARVDGFVVFQLVVVNERFDWQILKDGIELRQNQRLPQAAHSAVSIGERVDKFKLVVEDATANQQVVVGVFEPVEEVCHQLGYAFEWWGNVNRAISVKNADSASLKLSRSFDECRHHLRVCPQKVFERKRIERGKILQVKFARTLPCLGKFLLHKTSLYKLFFMSKEYYTLSELIDNNGGLLNDESLHFMTKHGLLGELLLCDNRLGEEAFLALPAMGYAPNSNELACYLYMCDALDCKMMEALNLTDAVMLELLCLDLSLLPAVRAKGLFWRLDEGQFARIFINAYLAAENTELVAELQKRGWNFMDAVILDCPEIIPTLERMGADLGESRYAEYLSK